MRRGAWASAMCLLCGAAAGAPLTRGGPGGIGPADGSGALRLWLRAHDLELRDGETVVEWPDRSGRGNTAVQGYTGPADDPTGYYPPLFRTEGVNGLPSVEFVREAWTGNLYGSHLRTAEDVRTDSETVFVVSRLNTDDAVEGAVGGGVIGYTGPAQQGLSENRFDALRPGGYNWLVGGSVHGQSALRGAEGQTTGWKVVAAARQRGSGDDAIALWENGALLGQAPHPDGGTVSGAYIVGALGRGGDHRHISAYHGWISEVIVFAARLNAAERRIVENHLFAKYAIRPASMQGAYRSPVPLPHNKLYRGDYDAFGNYRCGVFGIGRADAANQVLNAGTDGFGLLAVAPLEDGQWVFAGHRRPENAYVRDGSRMRWSRVWYVQNDGGADAVAGFNAADAGLQASGADAAAHLLLYSGSGDLDFEVVPCRAARHGDTLVFAVPGLPTGYYTLGVAAEDWPAGRADLVSDEPAPPAMLRFDEPMTAMINARRRDETRQQWHGGAVEELFFDAAHRFLLVRFPGSAEALHRELAAGHAIERIELRLTWAGDELRGTPGYANRAWPIPQGAAANWHAEVWMLRRPWIDDDVIGPTWNGYIHGSGWWERGGAHCPLRDRHPRKLGRGGLWKENPEAHIDVTAVLTGGYGGRCVGERLRRMEERGFLVSKAELSDYDYHQGLSIGLGRVFVRKPQLVVVLRRGAGAPSGGDLPSALDVRGHAARLEAEGSGGFPSNRRPERLEDIAASQVERRRETMPQWMRQRVEEVRDLPPYQEQRVWFDDLVHMVESLDFSGYDEWVDGVLRMPPGWFQGHSNIEFPLAAIAFGDLLPEVVRHHLREDWRARWARPLSRRVFAHNLGGTLNHCAQIRSKVLLGSEWTDDAEMLQRVVMLMLDLNRRHIYSSGFSQELGDSYYRGITMAPLQAAARYARDPVMRLLASLMVEKLLFEDISTYHPGLRKRVSRISRRMRENVQEALLLGQDVPEAALHMLSRAGVLIETDAVADEHPPRVQGMRVLDLHASAPGRVALVAPWGAEWEWHAIDGKPLPFLSVHTEDFGGRLKARRIAVTYLGRNYGLGSENVSGPGLPVFAVWRRDGEPVERVEQLGAMLLQSRINEQPPGNVTRTPMGVLQHANRLIYVVKPHERRFLKEGHANLPDSLSAGLTSFKAQVSVHAFGPEDEREIWIGERRVDHLPATARHGETIAIREGVTYIGLIALPATDLGRTQEVVIRYRRPELTLDSYLLDVETPLSGDDPTWQVLEDATAGWVVEMGDADEHGSFEAFRRHMGAAETVSEWDAERRVLRVNYRSGPEEMEFGFSTAWRRRDLWHDPVDPANVIALQRVNGTDWPPLPPGIVLDNPLGRMGTAGAMEKGGARLDTAEGRMALLRVAPAAGVFVGIQPFVEPSPFELRTPGGVTVIAEGPLGLARVAVRERENELRVDSALPPSEGYAALERLQRERAPLYRSEIDAGMVGVHTAKALAVRGFDGEPRVVLNGELLAGPFPRFASGDAVWFRIPIVR